jgi:hypothetical protein
VLESQTTARGRIDAVLAGRGHDASLYVSLQRRPREDGELTIVLAMPVRAVEGIVEGLEVDVVCEEPGCRIFLEGGDPLGKTQSFDCGVTASMGENTCRWVGTIDPPDGEACDDKMTRRGTMQFHRLRIIVPVEQSFARIGLKAVRINGDVRKVLTGLA